MVSYFTPLVSASMGIASKILDHQQQMNLLDQTKTLAESALQMLYCCQRRWWKPKGTSSFIQISGFLHRKCQSFSKFIPLICLQAAHTHDAIAEAALLMREAVDDLLLTLNEAASEVGMVSGMVDLIADAMGKVITHILWH